ncbi:MAG TPA: hypothetical protein PLK40_04965 [Bacteroidaceae bacterium]|nr:hypothetical protein [Bacteroidaceae bacterium]
MKWEKSSVTWLLSIVLLALVAIGIRQVVLFRQQVEMEKFEVFTLIPSSAVGVLQTDNFLEVANHSPRRFILHHTEKIPSYYYQYIDKIVVSEHLNQGVPHFLTYIKCAKSRQNKLIDVLRLINQSHYPIKIHHYGEHTIQVLPRDNGEFLAIYATDNAIVLSEDLYLLHEVIETEEGHVQPLVKNEEFTSIVRDTKYSRHKVFLIAEHVWTSYEMDFNGENIYFTATISNDEGKHPFLFMLGQQVQMEECVMDKLYDHLVSFDCFSTSNLLAWLPYLDLPKNGLWINGIDQESTGQMFHVTFTCEERQASVYLISLKQKISSQTLHLLSNTSAQSWEVVEYDDCLFLSKHKGDLQYYMQEVQAGHTIDKSDTFRDIMAQFEPPFSLFSITCIPLADTALNMINTLGFKDLIIAYPNFFNRFCVGTQISHANDLHYVNVVFVPK